MHSSRFVSSMWICLDTGFANQCHFNRFSWLQWIDWKKEWTLSENDERAILWNFTRFFGVKRVALKCFRLNIPPNILNPSYYIYIFYFRLVYAFGDIVKLSVSTAFLWSLLALTCSMLSLQVLIVRFTTLHLIIPQCPISNSLISSNLFPCLFVEKEWRKFGFPWINSRGGYNVLAVWPDLFCMRIRRNCNGEIRWSGRSNLPNEMVFISNGIATNVCDYFVRRSRADNRKRLR